MPVKGSRGTKRPDMQGSNHWMYRHGKSSTSIHNIWSAMLRRCRSPKDKRWDRYGGRGIRVCARWSVFENFYADMGERPLGMQLDRINNDGNYEPGNVRWATTKQQRSNRSDVILISAFGKTMNLKEWAAERGMAYSCLRSRIMELGWPAEDALTLSSDNSRRYSALKRRDARGKQNAM